jgi:hypothetical protein
MPAFDSTLKDAGINIDSEEIKNLMKNIPQTETQEAAPIEETPAE